MRFYVFDAEGGMFGTKWAYADPVKPEYTREGMPRCPVCQGAVSGLRWLPPHRVKLSSANPAKWGDFVWGAGIDLLVSARFKAIYEQEGMKGITTFYPPAEIVRVGKQKTGDLPPDLPVYHETEVERLGPELDIKSCGMVLTRGAKQCNYCHLVSNGRKIRWERVVINPDSWQGEDIFFPRGGPWYVVSERFKQIAKHYGLANVVFIPSEKYAYKEPHTFVRED
jgi:hypothetical protein